MAAVLERDRDQTTVYFHSVGIKKFLTSLATFAVVQDQSPGKKHAPLLPRAVGQSIFP
jgi:hypothetical protein